MSVALFVPGFIATKKLYANWLNLMAAKKGISLFIHEREYSGLIDKRARDLKSEIEGLSKSFNKKIHLIGHSRCGTDICYTLHKYPELKEMALSATTMASPHAGSLIADKAISPHWNLGFKALNLAMDILNEEGTVNELTSAFMKGLHIEHVEGIKYHAFVFWADKEKMPLKGTIDHFLPFPSDGTVSVVSQRHGFGMDITEMEACHKSQTLPFLYGWPIIRWFKRPYKKVWGAVFDYVVGLE